MIMSVLGVSLAWLPGLGWLGVGMCFCAVFIAILGMTDTKTQPNAIGMDVAANIVGSVGISWGIAFQVKHAGGKLDAILASFDGPTALTVTIVAFVLFFAAQILGRKINRASGRVIALLALLCLSWSGTTWLTITDRQMTNKSIKVMDH